MNARLIKETRELLPAYAGTVLLIIVPFLIWHADAEAFGCVALGLGCAVLGGCCFGNEFQHRTLLLLLSQPVSRSVLWRDKMLTLGAGITTILAVLLVCQQVYCPVRDSAALLVPALIGLCAFCGAPYWTLVCRQTIIGMACAAGFPVSLLSVYALLNVWASPGKEISLTSLAILLVIYCAVVFRLGYSQFKRLEVFDTAARELSLPAGLESALARPLARFSSRFGGPFASLLRKEFRLQQVSFLLAGVFFLIAVIGFCVFRFYRELGAGIIGGDYGLFVVLLPLVAGAMAVAEEKGWGVSEWHLTLPPSARQQWSAKMLAVLSITVVLGFLLPFAMFLAGEPLLRGEHTAVAAPQLNILGAYVLAQLLLTSVAIYAASFCKTTLRSVLAAFGIMIASSGVAALAEDSGVLPIVLMAPLLQGQSPLPVVFATLLLLIGLTQWFAWSNFRRSGASPRTVAMQVVILLFAVGLGSTAIFAAIHLVQGTQVMHLAR